MHNCDRFPGIKRRYAEPHRAYHTWKHVEHMLSLLALLGDNSPHDHEVCELAIIFHDAVYDPRSSANEFFSAALADQTLSPEYDRDTVTAIMTLIRMSDHTGAVHGLHPDVPLFLDIDLAILGADPVTFDAYERGIAFEYTFVPAPKFKEGRITALLGFLNRASIYQTEGMRALFEDKARANLARSISTLALELRQT